MPKRGTTTILALLAAGLTLGMLWLVHRPLVVKESTWQDVLAEGEGGGYRLITTEKLAELYRQDSQKPLLVDTREEWEFRTGHIPGSVNFPLEPTRWGRWRSQGPLASLLGPDKDRPVVFY